jgi:hypothetical protein
VSHPHRYAVRLRLTASAALALAALLAGPATWTTVGQTTSPTAPTLIRVEEDWSLTVNRPNADVASPQVSTQMARAPWASRFCNLHLNSVDVPSFAVGGLQLQAWNGTSDIAVYTSPNSAIMSTDIETATWTQYLRLSNGQLYFGIGTVQPNTPGASSQTWGDFSGMEITVTGATPDLSNYDPTYSVQNSGVTFGANRVNSLTLVQVRYYDNEGGPPYYIDLTPRPVYSAASDPQFNPNP